MLNKTETVIRDYPESQFWSSARQPRVKVRDYRSRSSHAHGRDL